MDAAQWQQQHQQIAGYSRPMEEMIQISNSNNNNHNPNNNPTNMSNKNNSRGATPVVGDQRRARPQKDQNLNCPRCNSTNTKFCYYNNYSLTQPRYFCKTCRRYWTQGGSLRNVPVGGGSRKNKRSSTSSSSSIITSSITTTTTPHHNLINTNKLIPDLNPPNSLSHLINPPQNPKFLEGHDLNLAFPIQGIFHPSNNENNHEPINIMNTNHNSNNNNNNLSSSTTTCRTTNNTCSTHPVSALELLRTGIASRGTTLNPYVPMPMPMPDSNTLYPSGLPNLQEFKTNNSMNDVFSSPPSGEHNNMVGSGDGNVGSGAAAAAAAARLLFPFADMNKLANSTPATTPHHHHQDIDDQRNKAGNDHHHHHHHQGPTTGYWSGMLGGGTW